MNTILERKDWFREKREFWKLKYNQVKFSIEELEINIEKDFQKKN